LRALLDRERFDLVICHMPWALAIFGATVRGAGQPLGFWAHAFHDGGSWLELLANRISPNVTIANSRFTEAGLKNLFPNVRRDVIYPPVALTLDDQAAEQRLAVRKELGVGDDTVVIIQVSRIEACKGHLSHLNALARLKDLPERWVCWMVGGAQRPEEQKYLRMLQESTARLGLSGRVKYLGQRTDVSKLLAAADIFCQPNQTPDSFGLVFVEALWASRPVITTALGGAMEIVDGSCGMTVISGDAEGLEQALKQLIQNAELRSQLGRAGKARASHLCDPVTQMQLLTDVARSARGGQAA
jgi:glycosyltransferase involved in cell wall biosynthesis